MAKFEKRQEARRLRIKGLSIKSIAKQLGVSKSSASLWCLDLKLTEEQREVLIKNAIAAGHKGRILGTEMNKRKKQESLQHFNEQGIKDIGILSRREFLIAGVALYWGEGSKKSKMSFVNSDPQLILFMFKWFQEIMGVEKDDFMPRIFINEMHRPRAEKILAFWSNLLDLPREQFGNIVFLKMNAKKVYDNYDDYFGVLALGSRKSTSLKYRILGLIEALRSKECLDECES